MNRKEMVKTIYSMAEEAGFTVRQLGTHDVILQPKTDDQVAVAQRIVTIYENVGFIDGQRFNLSIRRV